MVYLLGRIKNFVCLPNKGLSSSSKAYSTLVVAFSMDGNMTAQEYSRQLQEKFELYLLALVFTVLGLAIQTASFGRYDLADCFELLAWILLLISGIAGLSRLEWVPVAYHTLGTAKDLKNERKNFIELLSSGVDRHPVVDHSEPLHIQELIDDRSVAIVKVEQRIKQLEESILRKYSIHKWCFVVAVAFLVCARGYPVADTLARKHLTTQFSLPALGSR